MGVAFMTPNALMLYLSQKFEPGDFSGDPKRELFLGWMQPKDGQYVFTPVQRDDETAENKIMINNVNLELARPETMHNLNGQNQTPWAIKKLAPQINEWTFRVVYWDMEEGRIIMRMIIALAGTLDVSISWGEWEGV